MKCILTAYFKILTVLIENCYAVSLSNTLNIKTTIGKPSSGKVNLSYGSSHIIQMPMRYPTGFV
ncbi:MAG: hypothetical protein ACK5UE_08380 [Chitinophagales bacterium]|nr:hypothetical protein [Sphingobacteriales bacterium]